MKKTSPPPRYPNLLLVTGVVVGLAGGLLMLWNLGYLPEASLLWPVVLIVVGLSLLYLAWPRRQSDRWIIPGMVLTLCGVVFLLMNTVLRDQDLVRIWPAFMLVTGLSLVPYGLRRHGAARTAIMVPGLFICALALLFLPFSLRGTGGELSSFVRQWWPLVLVILGAALVVSFFSTRRPNKKV
ncbi:MAG TPA: DUF5668 domain-containing protein [bacterium]|nr:DUF5668 domain-containing protein [bacterium]